jgi:hypothetical protein
MRKDVHDLLLDLELTDGYGKPTDPGYEFELELAGPFENGDKCEWTPARS